MKERFFVPSFDKWFDELTVEELVKLGSFPTPFFVPDYRVLRKFKYYDIYVACEKCFYKEHFEFSSPNKPKTGKPKCPRCGNILLVKIEEDL